MKWGVNWRKLYRDSSHAWLGLPLLTRGFGDELIKYADDEGRLYLGAVDAVTALSRLMGAHACERRALKGHLETLIADGFCRIDGQHLVIRNFVIAQTATTPSGDRMRTLRGKAVTSDEHQADIASTSLRHRSDSDATSLRHERDASIDLSTRKDSVDPVTVTTLRLEENRLDKKTPEKTPKAPAGVPPAGPVFGLSMVEPDAPKVVHIAADVAEVFGYWQTVHATPRSVLDPKRHKTIRAAINRHGVTDCKAAIDGCLRSDYHQARPGGRNETGRKFNDVELILRDAKHVEMFLAIPMRGSPNGPQRASTAEDFARIKAEGWNDPVKKIVAEARAKQAAAALTAVVTEPLRAAGDSK